MGTPDMLGTPGTFSFYTDFPPRNMNEITGGVVYVVDVIDRHVAAALHGPPNSFRNLPEVGAPEMTVAFDVYLDPVEPVAKFVVGDEEFILKQGEWSDWIGVEIEALPHVVSVSAAARFYLQEVRPDFKLYVSPLQIDPLAPAMPISTPGEWSRDLAETLGRFYTQELPEDTKAYTGGIFTAHEFWEQSQFVYREQRRALDAMLDEFERGLLFFYFSSVDQGAHMLWAQMDPAHPAHERDELLIEGIATLYEQMDEALGRVMEFVDDETTLIVMSDHGFAPFEWGFNLNSWLASKGYVTFSDPERQEAYVAFQNVDWSGTRAYAVGLNGLYVNLKGRETRGVVEAADYDALLDELERELLAERNPANGEAVATRVTRTRRDLHGPEIAGGPDIIVGYNRGHRSSWESPLGEFPREILVRNLDRWSGDHAMDPAHVPGVLLTNQRITLETPALYDLTVAVLDEFGVAPLSVMLGRDCLAPPPEKP
jgi:predicted AlkP superfamily phosphohydrolase/phosphomutase